MASTRPKVYLHPINWVQRIALYATEARYYLIGSNNTQTAFKVLKIDRTNNDHDLSFVDDRVEYNYQEIRDLIVRIDQGNLSKSNPIGVTKKVSSFGLLGFIRFLHGYYLILIIKRRKVAVIGYHTIYKVEETKLIYIPNKQPTELVNEETKLVRAFNSIDLSSNFYFSYSYDISHSLQYNLSPVRGARFLKQNLTSSQKFGRLSQSEEESTNEPTSVDNVIHKLKDVLIKTQPNSRFVWNSHMLDFPNLHDDWKLNIIHGFVSQANLCVYGKPIYITLVARRSRRFCGTRFFKRGLNLDGDVANEVETEQIVHDSSVSDFSHGFFTSFVQMRGSLPDRWSQEATKIVPKPQIIQDFVDPYYEATAKHFNDLLHRYGTPIVLLNLVKQKERKPHETILSGMINKSVGYLNQFLPQQHKIRLMSFDMARCSKNTNENVMRRLGKIGFNIVRVTGVFQSWRSARKSNYDSTYTLHLRQRSFSRRPSSSRIGGYRLKNGQCLQNGVVRVNCVDSLDRTNTAQFVLGKVALAFQLQALGVLIEPKLEYDTDSVRLLEQLYEDHGDTIALQYGGSQLVHRVKTYRKTAPITSHSSEIMQTLQRYYSNTFSDSEKQNVINIFLGIRKPFYLDKSRSLSSNSLHELLHNHITDYYLHNPGLMKPFYLDDRLKPYTRWWDRKTLKSLPRSYNEFEKETTCYVLEYNSESPTILERVGFFLDAYRPYEMTFLSSSFSNQILHSINDLMPYGSTNLSPFCLRLGPGRLREIYLELPPNKRPLPNPSVFGRPSTDSNASDISFLDSDLDDDDTNSDLDDLNTHPTAMNTSLVLMRSALSREQVMTAYQDSTEKVPLNIYSIEVHEQDKEMDSLAGYTIEISAKDKLLYMNYIKPVGTLRDPLVVCKEYEDLIDLTNFPDPNKINSDVLVIPTLVLA